MLLYKKLLLMNFGTTLVLSLPHMHSWYAQGLYVCRQLTYVPSPTHSAVEIAIIQSSADNLGP